MPAAAGRGGGRRRTERCTERPLGPCLAGKRRRRAQPRVQESRRLPRRRPRTATGGLDEDALAAERITASIGKR